MQTAEPTNTPDAAPKNLVHLSIPTPQGDASAEAMTAVTYAESFAIVTVSDSVKAQEARQRLNTKIAAMDAARLALTRPIDAAKKTIMDFFNGPKAKLEQARGIFDKKIISFDNEQERIRQEAQRKVEAEAAAERKRLQDIADAALRKANEEAAKKRRLAEEAAGAGRAEEAARLASQADKIETKAEAKAETFQSRAASVVAPIIQSESAKAAGSSFRDNWTFRITDPKKINAAFLTPDEVKIGKLVKSLKLDAAALIGDGIEIFNDRGLASKRA